MNTKFTKGDTVKPTGGTLRIYTITGLSDTGYYMKNIVSGVTLGYDPSDNHLLSATVEDVLKAYCYEEIMFDNSHIDECIKAYKAQLDFSIQWNDNIDGYPPQLMQIIAFDFGAFAKNWRG